MGQNYESYMVNETYGKACTLIKNIEINKLNGFYRQAQKECNMLQTITKDSLIPELEALKRMMEIKGVDSIIFEHPSLHYIVDNYNKVFNEVVGWKNIKI